MARSAAAYARSIRSRYGTATYGGSSPQAGGAPVGRLTQVEGVLRPMGVKHRNTGSGKIFGGCGDCAVDRLRALGSTEHQQYPGIVGEPEVGPRLGLQRPSVQGGDRCPYRHTDHFDVPQSGIRHRRQHAAGRSRADPVGPARARVRLVHDHRNSAPPPRQGESAARGQICRQRDISAESDDDIGIDVVEHRPRLPHRPAHPHRQPDQIARWLAWQRNRGDELQVIAAFWHQPRFQTALCAQRRDPYVRVERGQRVRNGHCGLDMPRCAAARKDDRDPPVATLLPPGGRNTHP